MATRIHTDILIVLVIHLIPGIVHITIIIHIMGTVIMDIVIMAEETAEVLPVFIVTIMLHPVVQITAEAIILQVGSLIDQTQQVTVPRVM
jgi:hypothetical protein